MGKVKNWFFKNLAKKILEINPKIEIVEEKKRVPVASFESNDLWLEKQGDAQAEEDKQQHG